MVEAGEGDRLALRQAHVFFAPLDGFHQERHIFSQGAHGLQALFILQDFLGRAAMHHVPILAGGDGHIVHGKILVEHIKGSGIAAPPASDHRRANLHGLVDIQRAEEQTVHKGDGPARRGSKVHRRAYDKSVRLGQLGGHFVDDIVKHAFAGLVALAAGNTASHILVANVYDLRFDPLVFQRLCQFGQGSVGAAFCPGAAVDELCFHDASSRFSLL